MKVKLEENKDFCTYVSAGQKSAVMLLTLKSHDATSVSFPIIPIKLGKVSVKVSVAAEHADVSLQAQFGTVVASDVVLRKILVVVSLIKFLSCFVHSCKKNCIAARI